MLLQDYYSICYCVLFRCMAGRRKEGDTRESTAQLKEQINMDKPLSELTFVNPAILFNVLDCTLMDTSSHTSSPCRALYLPLFSSISAIFSSQGNLCLLYLWLYHFQYQLGSKSRADEDMWDSIDLSQLNTLVSG